jgi:hypothetical protein
MSLEFDQLYDEANSFLCESIYKWLESPDEVLTTCNNYENEYLTSSPPPKRTYQVYEESQPKSKTIKQKLYRRGPYRKKNKKNDDEHSR